MKSETVQQAVKRYIHFIEWSEADGCFIGYCPDLAYGGMCHDVDPVECYRKLAEVMDWFIEDELEHGRPLPEPTPQRLPEAFLRRANARGPGTK